MGISDPSNIDHCASMIEHLPHSAIDKRWWDAQLLRCSNKMWYAQSWVLDIASPGWEALVDRGSGAIMPLTWRKKYGVRYLYQPYGLQQLGVFAPAIGDGLQGRFLDAVPQAFKYWDIYLNTMITSHTTRCSHQSAYRSGIGSRSIR